MMDRIKTMCMAAWNVILTVLSFMVGSVIIIGIATFTLTVALSPLLIPALIVLCLMKYLI